MVVGRNASCPCGSGKKYKKCCLRHEGEMTKVGPSDPMQQIRRLLADQEFASLDEAQVAMDQVMAAQNRRPLEAFHGLSPEQMHRLLHFPTESPELLQFVDHLDREPEGPLFSLFGQLVEGIGEQGMKPTATGNLPRNFCRETAVAYYSEEEYLARTKYGAINAETDFFALHVTRVVAELAGLVRKYRGKFILSRDCRKILANRGLIGLGPVLLSTLFHRYNWGYWDGYADLPFLQQSFAFSLYLLHSLGDRWRDGLFYARQMLTAFPMLTDEIVATPYTTAEEQLLRCYAYRCLDNVFVFGGLARHQQTDDPAGEKKDMYRKTELLDRWVQFRL